MKAPYMGELDASINATWANIIGAVAADHSATFRSRSQALSREIVLCETL